MNTAFNLLNYPLRAHQQRWRWRLGSGLSGLLIGLVLGGLALHWLERDMAGLSDARATLHGQLRQVQQQARDDQTRQAAVAKGQSQQAFLTHVQAHQQAWLRLHQALLDLGGQRIWVLERLHVEGARLTVQGRIKEVQALDRAQARLSAQLQLPLVLESLVAAPTTSDGARAAESGHVFVWQGAWPAVGVVSASASASAAAAASSPGRQP